MDAKDLKLWTTPSSDKPTTSSTPSLTELASNIKAELNKIVETPDYPPEVTPDIKAALIAKAVQVISDGLDVLYPVEQLEMFTQLLQDKTNGKLR